LLANVLVLQRAYSRAVDEISVMFALGAIFVECACGGKRCGEERNVYC